MSIQARQWARGRARKKLMAVLSALADYADKCGVAWVAQETLAHDTSCHRRTVVRDLNELEQDRLIRRLRAHDDGGHRDKNFTVLAPNATDRGPMVDADDGAYPPEVTELARRSETGPALVPVSPPRDERHSSLRDERLSDDLGGVLSDDLSGENASLSDDVCARTEERQERKEQLQASASQLLPVVVGSSLHAADDVELDEFWQAKLDRFRAEERRVDDRAVADLTDEELLATFPGSTIEECA